MRTVLVVVLAVLLVPTASGAETPPLLNWGEQVPGFHLGLDPSSSNECTGGDVRCVHSAIRKMNRDLRRLARGCDHDAIFQLGYTRTTEAYLESALTPGFYSDVPWMHHYDAVFASYYFQPQQEWAQGDATAVAPAWREAFQSADAQELTGTGNFLMGMNAHINRDLPFVLRDIGLTAPDGTSRKPDHERVNEFLNDVGDDLTPEMAARFDPAFDSGESAGDIFLGLTVQQVIQEWRERAWHNAWLMSTLDPVTASLVARGIEEGSALLARQIRQAVRYDDAADRDARNAWCAEHGMSYDGFDGTYLDGDAWTGAELDVLEPLAPTMTSLTTSPLVPISLSSLRLLGIRVSVSPAYGVSVTVG